jgi:hypothetical protein
LASGYSTARVERLLPDLPVARVRLPVTRRAP